MMAFSTETWRKLMGIAVLFKGELATELSSMNSALNFASVNSGLIVLNFPQFSTSFYLSHTLYKRHLLQ